MRRILVLLVAIAGCSSPTPDPDGGPTNQTDAHSGIDAPSVAVDAASPIDSGPRTGGCTPALPTPTAGTQTARPKTTTCAALGYWEYVPPDYASHHDWPVILAFHGDGERGDGSMTQLAMLLNNGLTQQIQGNHWDPGHRFVVISPQMDDRNGMTDRTGPVLRDFITFVLANYDVDPHRVYLTGLSGGGEPIYNYMGSEHGGIVAAVLPISGWYSTQNTECTWSTVPIWYFHGAMDTTVPAPGHSTASYDHMIACSPAPTPAPRYTLFANRAHDDWNLVYDLSGMNATTYPLVTSPPGTTPYDTSIYDWFLQYTR